MSVSARLSRVGSAAAVSRLPVVMSLFRDQAGGYFNLSRDYQGCERDAEVGVDGLTQMMVNESRGVLPSEVGT